MPTFRPCRLCRSGRLVGVGAARNCTSCRSERRDRRLRVLPKSWPRTDDVENRTAGTDELARRRPEHALLDSGDRLRELRFQPGKLGADETRGHSWVRPFEELVDDLDLFGTGA